MQEATLCFLIKGNPPQAVLLGLKKAGFGAGKYGGFGGKIKPGETATRAAARELLEEAGITVSEAELQPMGRLTFLFPVRPGWNQVVHVFVAVKWHGEPVESEEMRPLWFDLPAIPFERMWQDGVHWLPQVLAGEPVDACFVFAHDNETVASVSIHPWGGG